LWFAHIYISPLDSLAFQLKKQGIVNEFLDWLIIRVKVKIVIDKRERKPKFAKEVLYFLGAFTITPSTFKKFNLQVVKGLWIEVSLKRVVFKFETHQVVNSIHMDLSVIRVLKIFRTALNYWNIFLRFNRLLTDSFVG